MRHSWMPRGAAILGVTVAVLCYWLTAFGAPWTVVINSAEIKPENNLAFVFPAPRMAFFSLDTDSMEEPSASTMRLFENGVELSPPHTSHANIRTLGRGKFSHWNQWVYFSSSDMTDPRTNGRSYEVRQFLRLPPTWGRLLIVAGAALAVTGLFGRRLSKFVSEAANKETRPDIRPLAKQVATFALLCLGYTVAVLLIDSSVNAQQQGSENFKINFEYKVF